MEGSVKVQGNPTAMTIAWARWKAALPMRWQGPGELMAFTRQASRRSGLS